MLLLTFGTGIGSALFSNGVLVPNTELGHLEVGGVEAEALAAGRHRDEGMPWPEWAGRFQKVLRHYEEIFSPGVIILGGGISKESDQFLHLLKTRAMLLPAELRNHAGIVGAALTGAPARQ